MSAEGPAQRLVVRSSQPGVRVVDLRRKHPWPPPANGINTSQARALSSQPARNSGIISSGELQLMTAEDRACPSSMGMPPMSCTSVIYVRHHGLAPLGSSARINGWIP